MRIDTYVTRQEAGEGVTRSVAGEDRDRPGFTQQLRDMVTQVNAEQQQAEQAMQRGALVGARNIHETMIQIQEAEIGMKLMVKLRNKALDAYNEIMRMQV